MSEGKEAVKEVKEFIKNNSPDLVITDVPKKVLQEFKDFANEEFSCGEGKGHYGFALKFLVDFYVGRVMDGSAIAEAKADEALDQISELRSVEQTEEKKTIKLCNGKELKMR